MAERKQIICPGNLIPRPISAVASLSSPGGPVRRESGSSPSKRVSFMPPLAREEGDEDLEEEEGSDEELEDEMEEEQDPNVSSMFLY